ncbi:MAG: NAD(+) diphosphatase [Bacteroides sp.]|nr:NAD(+) diphosphatase [Bacteroides sp.]
MTKVIIDGEEREVGLREAWNYMTEEGWKQEARKAELDYFFSTHRFCGTCGAAMQPSSDISLKCPACGREDFPSLSPAILVLIKRGEEALLVHARSFTRPVYALVAGFVETGENLEECVRREIREETSLEVSDIRYFGSQSWPFPSQLMIAFTADYAGGELRFADGELSAGGWFSRRNPPALPTLPSLSRQLIDAWISGKLS